MKVIKRIIEYDSRSKNSIFLVPFGDLHVGHKACDLDAIYKTRDFILEHDRTYWIGMGDYAEVITARDLRHDYQALDVERSTPDKQFRFIEELFRPIKDKCIGLLDGNHEYKYWMLNNHNYTDQLAYNLGVPYLTYCAYIRLIFKRRTSTSSKGNIFNIYAHHGSTGARSDPWKVRVIQDMANHFPNLNLYLMGHVHKRGEAPPQVQLYVDKGLRIREREQRFVFTGSYLKSYEEGTSTYASRKGYKPSSLGSPIIEIKVLRTEDQYTTPKRFAIRVMDLSFFEERFK